MQHQLTSHQQASTICQPRHRERTAPAGKTRRRAALRHTGAHTYRHPLHGRARNITVGYKEHLTAHCTRTTRLYNLHPSSWLFNWVYRLPFISACSPPLYDRRYAKGIDLPASSTRSPRHLLSLSVANRCV